MLAAVVKPRLAQGVGLVGGLHRYPAETVVLSRQKGVHPTGYPRKAGYRSGAELRKGRDLPPR